MKKIFKRKLEDKIKKFMHRREIIGIRGARQTGKTTLLKLIAESIGEGDREFINLDISDSRRELEEHPLDFVKRFKKPQKKKFFLFLDEVQKVKDGGEKLKVIFDSFEDVKVFVSGSSSLELKTNILPSLVGRLFLFELFTFDFEEFLLAKDEGICRLFRERSSSLKKFLEGRDEIAPPAFIPEFLRYWKNYAVFGGYPEVVKTDSEDEKIAVLKNIVSLYLEKDIAAFFKIEETQKFEDFLRAVSFNVSQLLSISSLASDLRISYGRAEEFLTILQHTYIIHTLKPFHKNLVTELKKSPKVYFLDLGLRNAVIGNFSKFEIREDKGKLIENFVLRELLTTLDDWRINYWRTTGKAEVDFVLSKNEQIVPIEVKLSGEKLGKSFYSFLNAYKPEKAIIVTLDKFKKQKINDTTIYWVPVAYF